MFDDLKYTTVCKLNFPKRQVPCGAKFLQHSINIPIIGESPEVKTMRFFGKLKDHLQSSHPIEFRQLEEWEKRFSGYLIASFFATEDPSILNGQAQIGYHLHQMTRQVDLDDEALKKIVAHVVSQEKPLTEGSVLEMVKEVRDLLTHKGKYEPRLLQPGEQPQT